MRLSEFAGKRIINISDGGILGTAGESDLLVDAESGNIVEIILPQGRSLVSFGNNNHRQISIPWQTVKKVGSEVIVVEIAI